MHSQLIYTLCVDVARLAEGMGPQAIHLQYTVLECWQKRLRAGIRPKGTRTQTQCCIVLNLRNFRWFSTETVLSQDRCKLQMTTTQPMSIGLLLTRNWAVQKQSSIFMRVYINYTELLICSEPKM